MHIIVVVFLACPADTVQQMVHFSKLTKKVSGKWKTESRQKEKASLGMPFLLIGYFIIF
jgi:hypothetical protein